MSGRIALFLETVSPLVSLGLAWVCRLPLLFISPPPLGAGHPTSSSAMCENNAPSCYPPFQRECLGLEALAYKSQNLVFFQGLWLRSTLKLEVYTGPHTPGASLIWAVATDLICECFAILWKMLLWLRQWCPHEATLQQWILNFAPLYTPTGPRFFQQLQHTLEQPLFVREEMNNN